MKLLIEHSITESAEETDANGQKHLYLQGVFMQAETINKNKRFYSKEILGEATKTYNRDYVITKRSFGELTHPQSPEVDANNISHIITELEMKGNSVHGKAKILNTPKGQIVKGLIEGGGQLGMSSRALGSVTEKTGVEYVQDDFQLKTVDIVLDPSAPNAFVEALMENVNWVWDGKVWKQERLQIAKKNIKESTKSNRDAVMLREFISLMDALK